MIASLERKVKDSSEVNPSKFLFTIIRTNEKARSNNKYSDDITAIGLHTPVVAFFAELLLEVTQGETMAVHSPPVGDFLTTEEIRHHRLTNAHSMASSTFFRLPYPKRRGEGGVKAHGHPCDS